MSGSAIDLSVAITTAPRPRVTLRESYLSLRRAGFTEPVIVFADGPPAAELDDGVELIVNEPPKGGLRNWCYALETMAARPGWSWLLLLEDDVVWCRDGLALLMRDLATLNGRGDVGCYSAYIHNTIARALERKDGGGRAKPGIRELTLGWGMHGSQALALPRQAAEWLLADEQFQRYRVTWTKNRNRDQVAGKALCDMGLRTLFRVPGLCEHSLGAGNSSLRKKPPRNTRYFQGPPA